jgi:uncharacterized protein YbjT (DUF2867 family)
VARTLLAADGGVRAIGRKPERLRALAELGAEPAIGALDDARFLARALDGATGLYALVPYNYGAKTCVLISRGSSTQTRPPLVTRVFRASSVSRASALISLTTVACWRDSLLRAGLERLAAGGVQTTALRAGFFLENFLGMAATVHQVGALGGFPIRATSGFRW